MSDNKRFFYLKLKEDFFEDDTMRFLEKQKNGEKYALFYLKLCLKSLRRKGLLVQCVGNTYIPFDPEALGILTNTDIDTVVTALNLFFSLGIIEKTSSGEIYIAEIEEMIGSETDKARLMREKRAREKALNSSEKLEGNNVTQMLPKCSEMFPKSYLDLDLESDLESEEQNTNKKAIEDDQQNFKGDSTLPFGKRKNIFLTQNEYGGLLEDYGSRITALLNECSDRIFSRSQTYGKINNYYRYVQTIAKDLGYKTDGEIAIERKCSEESRKQKQDEIQQNKLKLLKEYGAENEEELKIIMEKENKEQMEKLKRKLKNSFV